MTPHAPSNARAILVMCTTMALFIMNDTFVKLAAATLPVGQVMALRGAFVVAIVLAIVVALGQAKDLARMRQPRVLIRSALEAFVAYAFISALAKLGIAELTAIFLTAPLMMTAASAVILKEQVGWRRWLAVVAGFCGMLFVVKPSAEGLNAFALLGLLSAVGSVTRDLVTRGIDKATPTTIVSLATGTAVALAGFGIGAAESWAMPSAAAWGYLFGAAVFVAAGNYGIILAFRIGEVSAISPFRYTIMVWALLSGYLIWGDIPDRWSLLGIAIIVGSGLYIVHRERVRRRVG
jgi:drug/metabolite transporter (DMT)-like permease